MRFTTMLAVASLLVLNTGCSSFREINRDLKGENAGQPNKGKPVPREQYDDLLAKYEDLSKKYEQLKDGNTSVPSSLVDELQNSQSENFAQTNPNVETVDVFAESSPTPQVLTNIPSDIEAQLELFRKGERLKASNQSEALKIFQKLEEKAVPAVKVRARLQVGELMFNKGQFDLALQVFEDIIHKNASSGVVLDALKYAVICSEKLGIKNKKDQYASMLNDVFETN